MQPIGFENTLSPIASSTTQNEVFLRISSINLTESAENCGFGHSY